MAFEMLWYGRDGKPITFEEWGAQLKEGRRVALTHVDTPDGRHILVSTVWLGLDHNFGDDGPPLIFETMTFDQTGDDPEDPERGAWEDIEARRYPTLEAALNGHEEVTRWVQQFGYEPVVQEERSREDHS